MTDSLRPALIDALMLNCHVTEDLANDGLNAVLDVLADRADEWWVWVEAAEGRAVDCRTEHWVVEPEGLIAVLRGDTEE